jgi:hypothetical protein
MFVGQACITFQNKTILEMFAWHKHSSFFVESNI